MKRLGIFLAATILLVAGTTTIRSPSDTIRHLSA